METWMIVALIAAIAFVLYFVMRKQTLPPPPTPIVVQMPTAPGIAPSTGMVPPNPPPPPPPDVQAPVRSAPLSGFTRLLNVPLLPSSVQPLSASIGVASKVNNVVTSSLQHIPVVGGALAAPGKAVSKIFSLF